MSNRVVGEFVFNHPEEKSIEWALKPEARQPMKEEREQAGQQQPATRQP